MGRKHLVLALVVTCVALIGAVGSLVVAQVPLRPSVPALDPRVISGPDFGFRVERQQGETLLGTLVVRVNGQWVDVGFAGTGKPHLLTAR